MGLKKYLFPLFLILFVFALIQYVLPGAMSIREKLAERQVKQSSLSEVEVTVKNVGALAKGLDDSEPAKRAFSYLPITSDHDLVMDKLNYIAVQNGVVLTSLEFSDGVKAAKVEIDPVSGVALTDGASGPPTATPQSFIVSLGVTGSYENVRSFFRDVSMIDRASVIQSFSIGTEKKDATGDVAAPVTEDVSGKLTVEFLYLAKEKYQNAYLLPVFERGSFDTKPVDAFSAFVSNIPPIGVADGAMTGRSNPFK